MRVKTEQEKASRTHTAKRAFTAAPEGKFCWVKVYITAQDARRQPGMGAGVRKRSCSRAQLATIW